MVLFQFAGHASHRRHTNGIWQVSAHAMVSCIGEQYYWPHTRRDWADAKFFNSISESEYLDRRGLKCDRLLADASRTVVGW